MFPRLPKLPRRVLLAVAYVYCLLIMVNRLSDVRQETEDQWEALRQDFVARAARVRAGCSSNPPRPSKLQQHALDAAHVSAHLSTHYHNMHLKAALKDIIYLPKHNLSWCLVPKVASTSWCKALLDLQGITGDEYSYPPLQVVLRQAFRPVEPSRVNTTINASLKFLFVRHPFQRLVSAFRNKLEDSNLQEDGAYFYKNYGRRIVQRFRKSKLDVRSVQANEEIKTLGQGELSGKKGQGIDGVGGKGEIKKDFIKTEEKIEEDYVEYRKEPTFEEYVDYLIDTDVDSYDEHWKPISRHCHVCEFPFDYIIRYENFSDEIKYLVRVLQEGGRLPAKFHLQWENRGGTDEDTTARYLSQVTQHKLWLLYEKYHQDFLYFGYTIDDYIRS